MDQTSNMVEVARFFMEFCMDESCGKCIPCRAGTVQMHQLLNKIVAEAGDADRIRPPRAACATWCANTSLCGLGQTAPNPVLSTMRYFAGEYEALLQPRPASGNGRATRSLPVV